MCKKSFILKGPAWSLYGLAKIKKPSGSNLSKFSPNFIAANLGSDGWVNCVITLLRIFTLNNHIVPIFSKLQMTLCKKM